MTARSTFTGVTGEALEALEDRARSGGEVDPAVYAAALAARRLAELAEEGKTARAEEAARAEAAEDRANAVGALQGDLLPLIAEVRAVVAEAVERAAEESPDSLLNGSRIEFPVGDAETAAHRLLASLGGPHERDHARYVVHELTRCREEAAASWDALIDLAELGRRVDAVREILAPFSGPVVQ